MRERLISPNYFELPADRRRELRRIVLSEIVPKRAPRRTARRTLAVAIGVFVVATAGIAGAVTLLLPTELDLSTEIFPEDRVEAIARLGAGIPLPPGGSFDALVDVDWTEDERGLAGTLAFNAWCQWTGRWIEGALNDDPGQQKESLAVMQDVPTWPQLVEVDGGGVIAGLTGIANAAQGGDLGTVATHYQTNCSGLNVERDAQLGDRFGFLPLWDSDPTASCDELDELRSDLLSDVPTDPYEYEPWVAQYNETREAEDRMNCQDGP